MKNLDFGKWLFYIGSEVFARDITELRRVYPDILNVQLQERIHLNKTMYPGSFVK